MRDLVETSVNMVHDARQEEVRAQAEGLATEKLIGYLITSLDGAADRAEGEEPARADAPPPPRRASRAEKPKPRSRAAEQARLRRRRKAVAKMLADQKLEEHIVEIELEPDEAAGRRWSSPPA